MERENEKNQDREKKTEKKDTDRKYWRKNERDRKGWIKRGKWKRIYKYKKRNRNEVIEK